MFLIRVSRISKTIQNMKKLILLLLFSISIFSQKTTITFDSQVLGESREITIGLPPSFDKNPNKKHPIIFLLDGDYLFEPFYSALNYGAYWDDLSETIIVGIRQNKKNIRFDDCIYNKAHGIPSGRGAKFIAFIGAELLLYVEKKYPVAPFQIIASHNTTAGFLNFFLHKNDPLFNAYISLSPELAPDMENRISKELSKLKHPVFYYQSNGDGNIKKLHASIKQIDNTIKQVTNPLLNYTFDNFKDASHYSPVLYSIPNAPYQYFDTYKPISSIDYSKKIVTLQSGYVHYFTDKYDDLFQNLDLKIPIRVNDFKAIEIAILKNKAYSEVENLAEIANKNYPKSMFADYELGFCMKKCAI